VIANLHQDYAFAVRGLLADAFSRHHGDWLGVPIEEATVQFSLARQRFEYGELVQLNQETVVAVPYK
jgi:hypothetical protein